MQSRFHIRGHPIHAMLVSYPMALYLIALLCDLVFLWTDDPFWYRLAFWTMLFGLIGNIMAALSGIIDFLALRKEVPNAKRAATVHLVLGWVLMAIYLSSLALRHAGTVLEGSSSAIPILLNLVGAGFLGIQGWYGGELVYRYGI